MVPFVNRSARGGGSYFTRNKQEAIPSTAMSQVQAFVIPNLSAVDFLKVVLDGTRDSSLLCCRVAILAIGQVLVANASTPWSSKRGGWNVIIEREVNCTVDRLLAARQSFVRFKEGMLP